MGKEREREKVSHIEVSVNSRSLHHAVESTLFMAGNPYTPSGIARLAINGARLTVSVAGEVGFAQHNLKVDESRAATTEFYVSANMLQKGTGSLFSKDDEKGVTTLLRLSNNGLELVSGMSGDRAIFSIYSDQHWPEPLSPEQEQSIILSRKTIFPPERFLSHTSDINNPLGIIRITNFAKDSPRSSKNLVLQTTEGYVTRDKTIVTNLARGTLFNPIVMRPTLFFKLMKVIEGNDDVKISIGPKGEIIITKPGTDKYLYIIRPLL